MVRRALHLLLIATVLLAGCSGLGGSDATAEPTTAPTTTTPESAPAPTPTRSPTPTVTPTERGPSIEPLPASQVPPGANATHVTDPNALLAAHVNSLRGDAYDTRYDVFAESGGETMADSVSRYRNDPERRRHVWRSGSPGSMRIQYYTEVGVFVNVTEDGTTRTYRAGTDGSYDQVPTLSIQRGELSRVVRGGTYTANGTRTVDGRTLARYDLTDPASDVGANATGYLLVDADGVVHRAVLNATFSNDDDGTGYFRYTYRVVAIGDVTISEPAWVANVSD